MENKKLSELAKKDIAIKNAIQDIVNFREKNDLTEENKALASQMIINFLDKEKNNKELMKKKLNAFCYVFKKNQGEIELVKAIAEERKNRAKSMENQNEGLKDTIYHYAEQSFGVNEKKLILDFFTVYTGTTKDKIDYDKEKVPHELKKDVITRVPDTDKIRAFLKENPNTDWGRCYDNKYLVIRGGTIKKTEIEE